MKFLFFILSILIFFSASAEVIIPTLDQIQVDRGTGSMENGVFTQSQIGESKRTVFSVYRIPFKDGSISFTWKVDHEQPIPLILDGPPNGKGTHNLLMRFNGGHAKDNRMDRLSITTFDGSTKERKRFQNHSFDHHAKPGQWHRTTITIEENKVTVVINEKNFMVTSEKLRTGTRRFCIGHKIGSLQIKDLKLIKKK